jgi:hypothetical protein
VVLHVIVRTHSSHQPLRALSSIAPIGCKIKYLATSHWAQSQSISPAIGRDIKASLQPLGATSRHRAASGAISKHCTSHWAQHQGIAPHQAQYQNILPAIGCNIKASHRIRRDIKASCQPLGMTSRHCAASISRHRATIGHNIQASCQPSGTISKHRASHQVQYPRIVPPSGAISKHCTAIGCNIQASCRQASGVTMKHRAAIRHKIKASRGHQAQTLHIAPHRALIQSIAPPSGAKLQHRTPIGR